MTKEKIEVIVFRTTNKMKNSLINIAKDNFRTLSQELNYIIAKELNKKQGKKK